MLRAMYQSWHVLMACLVAVVMHCAYDSEAGPVPFVRSSNNGQFYFRMLPDASDQNDRDKGTGCCRRVTMGTEDATLWTIEGWYAFDVYLSDDGACLVRLGNWPRGSEPSENDLAIAFYKGGKLMASYSTKTVIKDKARVSKSASHYTYMAPNEAIGFQEREDGSMAFRFVSIDAMEYYFSVPDGKLVSAKQL